jgi:hypothetical protein
MVGRLRADAGDLFPEGVGRRRPLRLALLKPHARGARGGALTVYAPRPVSARGISPESKLSCELYTVFHTLHWGNYCPVLAKFN